MTLISRLVFFNKKKSSPKSSGKVITDQISIVIPVRNNQRGVNDYLGSFFASHHPAGFPKEIIFIDNNSVPHLTIDAKYKQHGLPLKLLRCTEPGPAAARNCGVRHALGNWILFNDSDCLPTASLLSGYALADNGAIAYAGNIKALGNDKLSKYYESQEILIPLKVRDINGQFIPQYLITANTLIWKPALLEIGGFNEDIKIAAGEDIDLGLRLSQTGRLAYAFESIVYHNFDDGLVGFAKRFIRYGKGNKIIERLWDTNMKPTPFSPVKASAFNRSASRLQYLFLLIGYISSAKQIKKPFHASNVE